MQLFELVSPRLFRPLAGPNRAFYAELLLLLWEECRHTADYSILRAEAVSRAEDYFAALAKPLALDADDAGDEAEQPTRDPHTLALGFLLRLRRTARGRGERAFRHGGRADDLHVPGGLDGGRRKPPGAAGPRGDGPAFPPRSVPADAR